MRAWIVIAMMGVASSVAADVSVAGDGPPSRFAPCVAALRAALRNRYPRSNEEWRDEHYCELDATRAKVTFHCYGKCTDRNCHDDGCTRHDEALDISFEPRSGGPSVWTRDSRYSWQTTWERQLGAVRAELVQYGEKPEERVPNRELRRLQRTIESCAASLP